MAFDLRKFLTENKLKEFSIIPHVGADKIERGSDVTGKIASNLDLNGFSDNAYVLHFNKNKSKVNEAEKILKRQYDKVVIYNPFKSLGGRGYPIIFVE